MRTAALVVTPIVVAAVVLALVSGRRTPGSGGRVPQRDQAVRIHIFRFQPDPVRVPVGARVTWTNEDEILHTVTAGTRDYDPMDSGRVVAEHRTGVFEGRLDGKGASFSTRLTRPGTYHYFCSIHPGMEADVIVG